MKIVRARVKGLAMIIYSIICIMLVVMIVATTYRRAMLSTQAEDIDIDITTSLLGSAIVNLGEYGRTGQVVIHDYLPEIYVVYLNNYDGVAIYPPNESYLFNTNPVYAEEFSVSPYKRDKYLDDALTRFKELTIANMGLDDNMVPNEGDTSRGRILRPTYSSLENNASDTPNKVVIEEYTVINVYTYKEETPPYNQHTYTVTYRCTNENDFYIVPELSGVDKEITIDSDEALWSGVVKGGRADNVKIETTSVYARLRFYVTLGKNFKGEYIEKEQKVDRVVAVETK